MARIRTVKPEFWTSEQIMECSPITRLAFIGLWNFADDKGRMTASPKRIKAQLFPSDDFTAADIHGMIRELARNGLIRLYVVDEIEYLVITGWHHQVINRPQPSKIPGPPDDDSVIDHGTLIGGREGKGKERKGKDTNTAAAQPSPRASRGTGGAETEPPPGPGEGAPGDDPGEGRPVRQAPPRQAGERSAANDHPRRQDERGGGGDPWASREGYDTVERTCIGLLGDKAPADAVIGPMVALMRDGYDWDAEVSPMLLDLVRSQRRPIRTWKLLATMVRERVDAQRRERVSHGSSATPLPAETGPLHEMTPGASFTEAVLRVYLANHRKDRSFWPPFLGPKPGEAGCRVPAHLLEREAA